MNLETRIDNFLEEAIINGNLEQIKYLIYKGARIRDNSLHLAIMYGHIKIVQFLSESFDDYHVRTALQCKHEDIVIYFIENGYQNDEFIKRMATEYKLMKVLNYKN